MKYIFIHLRVLVPDAFYNHLIRKSGLIKCQNCKQMTNPGNYCERCGSNLFKDEGSK